MAVVCARCGAKASVMDRINADWSADAYYCQTCSDALAEEEEKREKEIRRAAAKVIVTTTPKVDGYYVAEYLGIESVEYVIGTGIFSEFSSSVSDFFGERSTAFEEKLQAAKQQTLGALKYRAAKRGANAVVGIDLDYAEFSGNRVALIVNGTLVKLAPLRPK